MTTLADNPNRTCTVGGCNKPHVARGLCHAHYEYRRRNPDSEIPLMTGWRPAVRRPPRPSGLAGIWLIPLTQGLETLIDERDLALVWDYNWYAIRAWKNFYAVRAAPKSGPDRPGMVHMHRLILDCPDDRFIDHINGNGLDNRRANLRVVTTAQNTWNQRPRGPSGYRGVSFYQQSGTWRAAIGCLGPKRHIGYFATPEEAARAYDEQARLLHGEFARLNFPNEATS